MISQESILMEGKPKAACHKIIIFFIKPSDSNLSGICVCVRVWVIVKAQGQILGSGWFNYKVGVSAKGLSEYFIDLWKENHVKVFHPWLQYKLISLLQ